MFHPPWPLVQVDPSARNGSGATGCGAPSSAEEGHTAAGAGAPLEIVHKALASVKNLGNWTYEVHQYFDYYR